MPKVLKQATISSLKGVVVVEDFQRHKNVLENPVESKENILKSLSYLKKKKPCGEVISSIGIGETLQNLQKHSDDDVVIAVKDLCNYWKLDSDKKTQPTIEVRYDNFTRYFRRNAVKLFTSALGGTEEDEKIADVLEREIFHQNKRLLSKSYKKMVRKIVFALRHRESEKTSLKNGTITQVELVKKYVL